MNKTVAIRKDHRLLQGFVFFLRWKRLEHVYDNKGFSRGKRLRIKKSKRDIVVFPIHRDTFQDPYWMPEIMRVYTYLG